MVQCASAGDMTEESSTISHLSDAIATKEVDKAQTTSSPVNYFEIIFEWAVVVIGIVGTAANGLILYALVVSKQHKKHAFIVNQNAIDFVSCVFLIASYAAKLFDVRLTGTLGYWLCMTLISDNFVWWGNASSVISLAVITVERYLRVVHHTWSKKWLRRWLLFAVMVFTWVSGGIAVTPWLFETSDIVDGECLAFVLYKSDVDRIASLIWWIFSFYVIILIIFIFCYGRIVFVIRRQAQVMARHNAAGSSTLQTQSNQNICEIALQIITGSFAV